MIRPRFFFHIEVIPTGDGMAEGLKPRTSQGELPYSGLKVWMQVLSSEWHRPTYLGFASFSGPWQLGWDLASPERPQSIVGCPFAVSRSQSTML